MSDYDPNDALDLPEGEEIEAYCVSCKEKRGMENPVAVWTSQGRPGTRGECPVCASTMFRMGKTPLHGATQPPKAIQVIPPGAKGRAARAAYIVADITQAEFAQQLGEDLRKAGINVWVDSGETADPVQWSTGVHPALEQCTHLVVVLSSFALRTYSVEEAWSYFLSKRKPVLVAVREAVDPPDKLRTRPRFDFSDDQRAAFRGLVEALAR
ncbi:MAG: toll/interleukin-1 receptor domain-containing protein [Anaerolineae bacterium]|nr:toll/interleukin-1 receptor domain-containing protein [Anaerolineae bacterium]